jgi:calcineurin-like phosphoesterase family protein
MTQILFTGDLHLGSPWATEHRGFTSVQSHDEFVMLELHKAVARDKDTTLYVLGDAGDTHNDVSQLGDLHCWRVLIMGNHDTLPWHNYHDTGYALFNDSFGMLEYKGMVLTHCPIHPMEMYRYTLNIHGHIHGHRPQLELPYFNVNWDIWSRPVSLQEVRAVL